MTDDLALRLRALGSGFNLPQVQALYAPLLAAQRASVRKNAHHPALDCCWQRSSSCTTCRTNRPHKRKRRPH